MKEPASGRLSGIGVGPGDPELMTLKDVRILAEVPVIAYPAPNSGESSGAVSRAFGGVAKSRALSCVGTAASESLVDSSSGMVSPEGSLPVSTNGASEPNRFLARAGGAAPSACSCALQRVIRSSSTCPFR